MGKNQHVVKTTSGWGVRGANNSKITKSYPTQRQAITKGRSIAINQGSELIIHGRNGQIREKNSYGNDPCPPKG
jgi:hypothetical protein